MDAKIRRLDPNLPEDLRLFLRLREAFSKERRQPLDDLSSRQAVTAILYHQQGYALCEHRLWDKRPVLWVEELYVEPAVRQGGIFAALMDWLKEYALYTGATALMGMVANAGEGTHFLQHYGARPVGMILEIAKLPEMHYQRAEPVPVATQPIAAKKPRKRPPAKPRQAETEEQAA